MKTAGEKKRSVWKCSLRHLACCAMPAMTTTSNPPPDTLDTHTLDDGLEKLLGSLEQLGNSLDSERPPDLELQFLRDVLSSVEFQSLWKVHEVVTTPESADFKPLFESAADLANDVQCSVPPSCTSETLELHNLLDEPNFQALLSSHDQVATKDYQPQLPDIPYEVDEDEESVKIVRLVKGTTEPLGATIHFCEDTGIIKIARVMHGGAADRSGLIHVGDEVHEVNGVKVTGKAPNEVIHLLTTAMGPITLKLVPGEADGSGYNGSRMRVRALFDYDPGVDTYTPCREAGLGFQRGDVLHVVCQDDPEWWQARREGDGNMRAGLIPGRLLQERKGAVKHNMTNNNTEGNKDVKDLKNNKTSGKFSPKVGKKSKKTKKIIYMANQTDDYDFDEVLTYEEVERYLCPPDQPRPIVLVGPPSAGRTELKKRLIESDPTRFCAPIPHTTRSKKTGEVEGEEYHFVSRHDMEKDIQEKLFLEHGEHKGQLYGTSLGEVKSVINRGQVCVVCPHPQALKLLRTPEIKPYVIYAKPPNFQELRETRPSVKQKVTGDEKPRTFTDEDLKEMLQTAERLESQYGHYFDSTIVNTNLTDCSNQLIEIAHFLQTEAQWVPTSWVR